MSKLTIDYSMATRAIDLSREYITGYDFDYVSAADIEGNPRTGRVVNVNGNVFEFRYEGPFYGDPVEAYLPTASEIYAVDVNRPEGFKIYRAVPEFPDIRQFVNASYSTPEAFSAAQDRYFSAVDQWYATTDAAPFTRADYLDLNGLQGTFTAEQPLSGDVEFADLLGLEWVVTGSNFGDKIDTTDNDDTVTGGRGNDTLNGFGGEDTAIFAGKADDYEIESLGEGVFIVRGRANTPAANQGTDRLTGFELAKFDDRTVKLLALPDIRPLLVDAGDIEFKIDAETEKATAQGTITVGRTDGTNVLLRATNAKAEYTVDTLTITDGTYFAAIGNVTQSLFTGKVEMNVKNQTGTITETADGAFKLAGLDVSFNSLSVLQDRLAFDVLFTLPGAAGGVVVDTVRVLDDALIIDANGPRFAAGGILSLPNDFIRFTIGTTQINTKNVSIEYNAGEDAFYFRSTVLFDNLIKGKNAVEADLSGSNFIRYRNDGTLDIVGSIKIAELGSIGKWGLEDVTLSFNSVTKTIEGTGTITTPLGVKFGDEGIQVKPTLSLTLDPVRIDGVGLVIDNINKPIPNFPLFFFQSIGGAVKNMSPANGAAIEFSGTIGASLGPQLKGSSLARADITGSISSEALSGSSTFKLLPIEYDLFGVKQTYVVATNTGTTSLKYDNWVYTQTGTFNFLDGFLVTNTALRIDADFNFGSSGRGALGIPNFVPYFGGTSLTNANYTVKFTNDGNYSNDFVAGWGQVTISKLGFQVDITTGLRFNFDGTVDRIGSHNLPDSITARVSNTVLPEDASLSSVPVGADYILLAARWDNASSTAQLVVTMPDGTQVTEDRFAQFNIAIVDEFSSSTERVAIAFNPAAGNWSVGVADGTGLGTVTSEVLGEGVVPTLTFLATTQGAGSSTIINYRAFDADSTAKVSFWYGTSETDESGLLIGTVNEADGTGSFTWDTAGLLPGTYYLYARLDDGESVPQLVRHLTPITIGGGGGDVTAPVIASANPALGATNVGIQSNLQFTFSEAIARGAGQILLRNAQGAVVETFNAATSNRIAINGDTLTIDPTNFLATGTGYTVSFGAGTIVDAAGNGLLASESGFQTIAGSGYRLIASTGLAATIGGRGTVIGTPGAQTITIADVPGTVTLDASFNRGNDRVVLDGNAGTYTVRLSGSSAQLSDGDTIVNIPVGPAGIDLLFDDGARLLRIDAQTNTVRIGDQTLTQTASTITAAAQAPGVDGSASTATGTLLASDPIAVIVGGNIVVAGNSGPQTVQLVDALGPVRFDASFNIGNDRIILEDSAANYTARISGSSAIIASEATTFTIPAGPGGLTLSFADGDRTLRIDTTQGKIVIGTQILTSTAQPITAPGSLTAPAVRLAGLFEQNDDSVWDVAPLDRSHAFGAEHVALLLPALVDQSAAFA